MFRDIKNGKWFNIKSKIEFDQVLKYGKISPSSMDRLSCARVQIGEFKQPGKYYLLEYQKRCSRNCCYDDANELIFNYDIIDDIKEEIKDLAYILKQAKGDSQCLRSVL